MSRDTEQTVRSGPARRGAEQRHRVRRELAAAALHLFATQGYEETTVDQIAAAAGVARRTFFRYFRSKEEAIFPEHDDTVEKVSEILASAGPDEAPLDVVCRAIMQVLRMYAESPQLSVERYRLIRQVPTLREREIASVSRYQRLFTRYLLGRFDEDAHAGGDDGPMLAEVAAAAVVAAHNHVLRRWLRSGGKGDVEATLDRAVDVIGHTFRFERTGLIEPAGRALPEHRPAAAGAAGTGRGDGAARVAAADPAANVVVAVARTDAPLPEVLAAVEAALRPTPSGGTPGTGQEPPPPRGSAGPTEPAADLPEPAPAGPPGPPAAPETEPDQL